MSKIVNPVYEKIKSYMREVVEEHLDCGEVNTTLLGEDCIHNSGLFPTDKEQMDALDDETHMVWDAACEVGWEYEQNKVNQIVEEIMEGWE